MIVTYASDLFKENPEDICLKDGLIYSAKNLEKQMNYKDLADRMYFRPGPRGLPQEMKLKHQTLLDVTSSWYSPNNAANPTTTYTTFSSGADIAIVEVDAETGATKVLKYVHVHDAGNMVSKEMIDGQIYGGILMGIGEALSEELIYTPQGDLPTNSYADYVMPTAQDVPEIIIRHFETPSPFTELGTKGMGESPNIGAKAAVVSAIEDALSPFHVRITETPTTRERVRQLILQAQAR